MAVDVAIVGATATGKTALAVALARRDPSIELASIDAYACYRRLDIGTAKPTPDEGEGVRWHLIDLVEPTEEFSITKFAAAARAARAGIASRANSACFVGGSGLYLRAVLDDLTPPPRFPEVGAELEAEATDAGALAAMHRRLAEIDPLGASRMEPTNRRRILRALEVALGTGRPFSSFGPGLGVYPEISCRLIGLDFDRDELEGRLAARLADQLERGFLEEVRALVEDQVTLSRTAAQAIGYRELAQVVAGSMTFSDASVEILRRSRQLARRQMAWLRRDPRILWVDGSRGDLVEYLAGLLLGS
ncbi:MAG TPA: tRNA (adenosine(37)-N6)-dimethylallyltransferase MiaA [Acidimicrobiales bacterium]